MVASRKFNNQEIEAIFAIGDINNDGEIDMDEFMSVLCPSAATVVSRLSATYKSLEEIKRGRKEEGREGSSQIPWSSGYERLRSSSVKERLDD